jgi:hypothetical protein
MKKIFVLEDDELIRQELVSLLTNSNFLIDTTTDFDNSLNCILKSDADLILMDINLPYLNGKEILKSLREKSNVPVIMVTSRESEIDEALSITYGADDYITKPYNPNILILRINAVLKRSENVSNLRYRNFLVNTSRSRLENDELVIDFTKNEMIIFMCLFNKIGTIVSRDEIMTSLWDNDEYINDNALTVNISRVRSKLEEAGLKDAIETKKGLGYILL